ncbi:MAG: amidohydrolase family protein [Candidatus Binatia bacterium]|nr:amidohydrolase family protein [Candidatus Binatia bacterium]
MIRLAISADGHISEPADLWSANLTPSLREQGPRVEVREGMISMVVENRLLRKLAKAPDGMAEGSLADLAAWGQNEPASRLEALASDGVSGEVLYPTIAFFTAYSIEDRLLQTAVCEVYNDWLVDAFQDPHFVPVAMLPSAQPDVCARELERLAPRGVVAGLLPAHSDALPYNLPEWEPLWETAAGLGISLSFHAGSGRHQAPVRGPGGAVTNYVVTLSGPIETATLLCASGVLERHPKLRVMMVECGAGWLAWALDAMDEAYLEHEMFVKPKLAELPSAYFRRQGGVTFQRDAVGITNRATTGDACLFWGSDYPHPEGTYPKSREVLETQFAGVPQDSTDDMTWRNTVNLYGLATPDGFDLKTSPNR